MIITLEDLRTICVDCLGQGQTQDESCVKCGGYGHLLTSSGHALVNFLTSRGIALPMSPLEEDELRGIVE